MLKRIWVTSVVIVLLLGFSSPADADSQMASALRLKADLVRQNIEAGCPLTDEQINDFVEFLTKPAADARETPSIEVGFHDSPGPDRTIPLGGRTPLILVHGSGSDILSDGEYGRPLDDKERWISYLDSFNSDPNIYNSYKVYRFVYDSRLSIDMNGANLVSVIDNIGTYPGWEGEDLDGRDFIVLAHSMGGVVSRAALNKQFAVGVDAGEYLGDHVHNLVTLGTPHHGSPAAVPAWVYDSVLRGSGMSETEFNFSYIMHLAFDPTDGMFDLAWDNYDDGVPLDDISTYRNLFIPVMNDVGGGRDQHLESLIDPYSLSLNGMDLFTGNLILYCAEDPPNSNVGSLLDLSFYWLLGILNEHHLLGYSFNKIAQVIAGDIGEGDTKPYALNDGLVPSSSATFDGEAVTYSEIFGNSDHLSLLDKASVVESVKNKLVEILPPGS